MLFKATVKKYSWSNEKIELNIVAASIEKATEKAKKIGRKNGGCSRVIDIAETVQDVHIA